MSRQLESRFLWLVIAFLSSTDHNVFSESSTGLHWFHVIGYDNILPQELEITSAQQMTSSPLECALRCNADEACNSFFYNSKSRDCLIGRNMVYRKPRDPIIVLNGSHYYCLESESCPAREGYFIDRVTATCFRPERKLQATWHEARAACINANETLTVLEPVEKARFVQDLLNRNYAITRKYLIGASRPESMWGQPFPASGPDYVWVNGQPLSMAITSAFWHQGNPAVADSVVGLMSVDGNFAFSESGDGLVQHYICERPFQIIK